MTGEEQQLAREIGLILRRLRLARGMTQQHLARRVAGGIDTTYIGKIERGDQLPSLKVLLRLSKTLGVTVSDFFYPSLSRAADNPSAPFHLEPLLQALRNRGIDGIALVRAILVLVAPPRRASATEPEPVVRADKYTAIPLPMPQGRAKD
jgi:transcriptional regulator with XRE-family HTH domain